MGLRPPLANQAAHENRRHRDDPVRIQLKPAYRMISALGKHWESHFVRVRLLTDEWLEGAGEAPATARWSGETVWSVQSVVDHVFTPLLVGHCTFRNIQSLAAR